MANDKRLVEGIDYYLEDGKMVLTSYFLLARGYCCNSGCRHCPYAEGASPSLGVAIAGLPGAVIPVPTGDGEPR